MRKAVRDGQHRIGLLLGAAEQAQFAAGRADRVDGEADAAGHHGRTIHQKQAGPHREPCDFLGGMQLAVCLGRENNTLIGHTLPPFPQNRTSFFPAYRFPWYLSTYVQKTGHKTENGRGIAAIFHQNSGHMPFSSAYSNREESLHSDSSQKCPSFARSFFTNTRAGRKSKFPAGFGTIGSPSHWLAMPFVAGSCMLPAKFYSPITWNTISRVRLRVSHSTSVRFCHGPMVISPSTNGITMNGLSSAALICDEPLSSCQVS